MSEKTKLYAMMAAQMDSLSEGSRVPLSLFSNCAALMWMSMPEINWCGFYLLRDSVLHLGPFQGKPACTLIPVGKGVCGTAAAQRRIQLVPDVHLFPGHIACDSASRSEIVLPLIRDGELLGVMDIDSPVAGRFDDEDAAGLQTLCDVLLSSGDFGAPLL